MLSGDVNCFCPFRDESVRSIERVVVASFSMCWTIHTILGAKYSSTFWSGLLFTDDFCCLSRSFAVNWKTAGQSFTCLRVYVSCLHNVYSNCSHTCSC